MSFLPFSGVSFGGRATPKTLANPPTNDPNIGAIRSPFPLDLSQFGLGLPGTPVQPNLEDAGPSFGGRPGFGSNLVLTGGVSSLGEPNVQPRDFLQGQQDALLKEFQFKQDQALNKANDPRVVSQPNFGVFSDTPDQSGLDSVLLASLLPFLLQQLQHPQTPGRSIPISSDFNKLGRNLNPGEPVR